MAAEAETLLASTAWLPEPLRTVDRYAANTHAAGTDGGVEAGDESAAIGGETAMVEGEPFAEDEMADDAPHAVAAE
jgi:ParB family chromosome partitioning protein